MYINSQSLYVDYNVDTFMEFMYLIGSINMYECANIMAGYIQPEFDDVKEVDKYGVKDVVEEKDGYGRVTRNYTVAKQEEKRNGSFFDKMGDLEE